MITLHRAPFGTYRIVAQDGQDLLVQTDYDFPSLATTFGWDITSVPGRRGLRDVRCRHDSTDGTIGCADCGTTASEFIDAARSWLDDHDGAIAEDPGYFSD